MFLNHLCNILCNRLYRYTAMLQNCVIPELFQRNALNDIDWIQDGAAPHTAKTVHRVLEQHFGDHIISCHFPFQ